MRDTRGHSQVRGFTLVELVVVIVILGVLGAMAGPRFFDRRVFAERGWYDELALALAHARQAAVASGCPVRIAITPAGYDARQQAALAGRCDPNGAFSVPVRLADGAVLAGSAPAGVVTSPSVTIVFDALGRTGLGADQAIVVGSRSLTVHAASGYVEAD